MNRLDQRLINSVIYQRIAPLLLVSALILAILGSSGTYFNGKADARRSAQQIADAQHNAVVSCENANESRDASRALWNYVLDLSAGGQQASDPKQVKFLEDFRDWVNQVYAPHDCSNLAKKYPLPDPPPIPEGLNQ